MVTVPGEKKRLSSSVTLALEGAASVVGVGTAVGGTAVGGTAVADGGLVAATVGEVGTVACVVADAGVVGEATEVEDPAGLGAGGFVEVAGLDADCVANSGAAVGFVASPPPHAASNVENRPANKRAATRGRLMKCISGRM